METMNTLDVTALEPRLKHPTIFDIYDRLNPGEAFVINNDHDPKPLYYQLLAERGPVFTWQYLEEGPELWKVKISKNGGVEADPTIGEIVTKDYRKAQVFKHYGIDFCCGGKKTIKEACEKKGIDTAEVTKALESIQDNTNSCENDYTKWDIGFLTDYIINTHHQYVKENTSFIVELANKVAKVHGQQHPEVVEVAKLFNQVGEDLMLHLSKEEKVLFPFIKELATVQREGGQLPESAFGHVSNPIHVMESEHEQAGDLLHTIREITHDFTLPANACNSYTILYKKLDEYENDLHKHVHLENNILFPKALLAEQELQAGVK
ncbi:iron-sulfur cluster repair di-iron protein [Pedobacter nutrimenti]|uniref:Regulator of cell morphogenesis and NO signaling n=1 Tax=Pedobacter nutrimenti TaxID=1241337 RepID=A0A318U9G2_9SPHI|nr:iron-sulfur cluster repair di-iron protein [Pedobacter nutrimenti]PYF70602.1 regulator of cell morphogenesis and NO signaling [Pedobacter nutrimenti]